MKTCELEGPRLDFWVGRAQGLDVMLEVQPMAVPKPVACWVRNERGTPDLVAGPYSPSTDWDVGGPIIEREWIVLNKLFDEEDRSWLQNPEDAIHKAWEACVGPVRADYDGDMVGRTEWQDGPTMLIAAMRAFVASKFGAEVPRT